MSVDTITVANSVFFAVEDAFDHWEHDGLCAHIAQSGATEAIIEVTNGQCFRLKVEEIIGERT